MKIRVTMKDPDTLHNAVQEAVMAQLEGLDGVDDDESEQLRESREEEMRAKCRRWFKWSEYLTVEIDTEAMTCVVVEQKS